MGHPWLRDPAEAPGSARAWASETTSTRLRRRGAVAWERSEPLGSTGPQFSFFSPWENGDFSGIYMGYEWENDMYDPYIRI